jgi:hypothetical protein
VTVESGILVRDAPHITARAGEALKQGTAFAAVARVTVRYDGLGEVIFVQVSAACAVPARALAFHAVVEQRLRRKCQAESLSH